MGETQQPPFQLTKCLWNGSEKGVYPCVACRTDAKPAPPADAGNTVDQIPTWTLPRNAVQSIERVGIGQSNGNPGWIINNERFKGAAAHTRCNLLS